MNNSGMKKITIYIINVVIILLASSCSKVYEISEIIEIKPNLSNEEQYDISFKTNDENFKKQVSLEVFKEEQKINQISLKNDSIKLKISVFQNSIPLTFIKGIEIDGFLLFIPDSYDNPTIKLPFRIYIKPWFASNYWVIFTLMFVVSTFFLFNFIMLIVKPAAQGYVEFMRPLLGIIPIYPQNLIFHFKRNIYTIGTSKKDDCIIKKSKCSKFKESHLLLTFKREKKLIKATLKSKTDFFYKDKLKIQRIEDPDFIREDDFEIPTIYDYKLGRHQELNELKKRGYGKKRVVTIKQGSTLIAVMDKDFYLSISI